MSGGEITQALVVALTIEALDKGSDLGLEIAGGAALS